MRPLPFLLVLAACQPEDDLDLRDSAVELELPDLSGVDLKVAYADALATALLADTRVAWAGHAGTVTTGSPGCPDFYAGTPDLDEMDVPEDEPGWSWADHCTTPSGSTWGGYAWWQNALVATGDAAEAEGRSTEAFRRLVADGVVADGTDTVLYEFDGEATDSLFLVEGDGWGQWTYSSLLDGTLTGAVPFDPAGAVTGGWRAEMYVRATGGDADTLEARGNLYLFEHRIADRFDSVAVNLEWASPESVGPDDCAAEPRGWIGLRTEDAYWFDLVFQPRFDDDPNSEPYENAEYTPCDGCGTLYVRGLEQTDITVCPDLTFLWSGGLTHPEPADYALSVRDRLGG